MENSHYSGNFNWLIPHFVGIGWQRVDKVQSSKVLFSAVQCIIVFNFNIVQCCTL